MANMRPVFHDYGSGAAPITFDRVVAIVCAAVAGLALAVALILSPPHALGLFTGQMRWLTADGHPAPALLALLPLLAAASGLASCLAALHAARLTSHAAAVPLLSTLSDLRAFLAEQRQDQAAWREANGKASHDATVLGARLASATMDAEARLAASVAKAEEVLLHPAGALARAVEAIQRLERSLPTLTGQLKRDISQLAAQPATLDSALARLDAAVETLGAAGGRFDGLIELAATIRRDATALDTAGREIAFAGAGLVARLGGVASQLSEMARAPIPGHAETHRTSHP